MERPTHHLASQVTLGVALLAVSALGLRLALVAWKQQPEAPREPLEGKKISSPDPSPSHPEPAERVIVAEPPKREENGASKRRMPGRQLSSSTNDLRVFAEAVGGHSSKQRGPAMLQGEGLIYKVFQDGNVEPGESPNKVKKRKRGEMEAEFYARVHATGHPLQKHQPKYYGVQALDDGNKYLVLEDLTYGYSQPCVLDLKMGKRAYDEDATPDKIAKERAKYPPQEIVGFRFSGMRVYQPATGNWVQSTREWCLSLDPTTIPDALERFFFDGRSVRRGLIRSAVTQITDIANCLEDFPTWRMYGASLLMIYDGASAEDVVRVKLIDFAHCYEIKDTGGKDYGFLHGVYFLLSCLNEILDRGRRNVTRRGSVVDQGTRLIVQSSERNMEDNISVNLNGEFASPLHPIRQLSTGSVSSSLDPLPAVPTQEALEILEHDPHLAPLVRKKRNNTLDGEDTRRMKSRRSRSMHDVLSGAAASGSEGSPFSVGSGHQRSPSSGPVMGSSLSRKPFAPLTTSNESGSSPSVQKLKEPALPEMSPFKLADVNVDVLNVESPITSKVDLALSVCSSVDRTPSQIGGAHKNIYVLDGTIEKDEVDKEQFDAEVRFYLSIQEDPLSRITPAFIRVDEHSTPRRLVLESVNALVAQPSPAALEMTDKDESTFSAHLPFDDNVNVMDVKLGYRTFRADVSNEPKSSYFHKYTDVVSELDPSFVRKVWKLVNGHETGPASLAKNKLGKRDYLLFRDATTTSSEYGFRLTAVKHENFEITQEEAKTRAASYDDFVSVLEHFLSSGNGFDSELAANFIQEIDSILEAMRSSTIFESTEFVGTSLLFVHQSGVPVIRWIDFANVSWPPSEDRNGIINGVDKIRSILDLLIRRPHRVDI